MIGRRKDANLDRAGPGRGATEHAPRVAEVVGSALPPSETAPEPVRSLADRLLQGSDDGVLACDERGVVRELNPAAARLLPEVRSGELLGIAELLASARAGSGEVDLVVGSRSLVARCQPLPDGWTAWHVRDVTEQHTRLNHLLAERARSRFLAAASRRLGLSLHPARTARAVVELATAALADAAIVVVPGHPGLVEWFGVENGGAVQTGRVQRAELPEPVRDALGGVQTGCRPLLDGLLENLPWAPGREVGSGGTTIVTLPGNGVPAGALVLIRRDARIGPADAVGEEIEAALVEEFSQRAGIALAAAALYAQQARTAAVLRRSLMQPELPPVSGMTFGAAYRPAEHGMLIGGDFYDVHPPAIAGGPTMFLLGDVCGKGVDAAVSTGRLRQSVQALRRVEDDPVVLLDVLNTTMLAAAAEGSAPGFVTLVLGTAMATADGGLRLRLAGGGHLPPLVVRRDGRVEQVEIDGMLVGAVSRAQFRATAVELAPGEACVLYTDGVSEARGGLDGRQDFGERRVAELLAGCHVMPAPAIAERIELHTTRWLTGDHHDDIAVLVVQAPLPGRSRSATGPGVRRHLHAVHASVHDEETA